MGMGSKEFGEIGREHLSHMYLAAHLPAGWGQEVFCPAVGFGI